jgi:hypothetical protein
VSDEKLSRTSAYYEPAIRIDELGGPVKPVDVIVVAAAEATDVRQPGASFDPGGYSVIEPQAAADEGPVLARIDDPTSGTSEWVVAEVVQPDVILIE